MRIFSIPLLALLIAASDVASAQQPSAETLKQVLTARLLALLPSGYAQRKVLFQEVRPGTPGPGSFPFQVTALIWDYGAGYPANRYYGDTCVGQMNKWVFTLSPDSFGDWKLDGRLTVTGADRNCKPNPSAGVSSIPLASLSGTPAAGTPAAPPRAPTPAGGAGSPTAGNLARGNYECWANGSPSLLLNFTVLSGTQYKGSDGKLGNYSLDAATGRMAFRGGDLDGALPEGFQAFYRLRQGRPTVSFQSPRGAEATFCQKTP